MLTLDRTTAEHDTCPCGLPLYLWWEDNPSRLTVQHGDTEAVRTFESAWVCTHGYLRWLAEVHEYERQRFLDEILAQARERGWNPPAEYARARRQPPAPGAPDAT